MADNRGAGRSQQGALSLVAFILGAALLAVVPLILLFLAFTGATDVQIPGTLIILSAMGGMILVIIGAALRD